MLCNSRHFSITDARQVDVFAGLNVMIIRFKLNAAAHPDNYPTIRDGTPKPEIYFLNNANLFNANRYSNENYSCLRLKYYFFPPERCMKSTRACVAFGFGS